MKRPTKEEAQHVSRFTETLGWKVIKNVIQEDIDSKTRSLINNNSMNLAEITQLRGEIVALQSILDWVKERQKQTMEN